MNDEKDKVMQWRVVHRTRAEVQPGVFEGVFLGVDGVRWMAGRMFTGRSMNDGFDGNGAWWYSHYYMSAERSAVRNMRGALAAYTEVAGSALVWDAAFDRSVQEAVGRYLAALIPLDGVPDMAASWERTGAASVNALGGGTYLLPAAEAKRELLGYLHRTAPDTGTHPAGQGLSLDEAYERVIGARGPVRFEVGRNTYWLTHDGHYSNHTTFHRHPVADERRNDP
ncbi:hypothetical protein IAG44_40005 [Streptomyces roseirectus]|uniref:Uncharacterized protein n=1 Tax=Streptomyces roseirectus TaxID=2768066 RepID=A0A7H0IQC9_9ACTN|nr:hypothetical protein [Streptomyces roseirectus]QNP74995.1 hypothetical protein IAG44_40005 [Streptomyces roseirectus]